MVERLSRDQIKRGMLMHGGPPADLSLTKVSVVVPVLAEIEAIDREYEARFKAELERLQRQAKRRRQ